MTLKHLFKGGIRPSNDEISKLLHSANGMNRFYSPYQYSQQNPYETYDETPFHSGHEPEYPVPGHTGRYSAPTFHHNIYSTISHGDMPPESHHGSKGSSVAMSALTLLAFLFFINILQSCLKEQMLSMNPTVMVMSAGTGRIKKIGSQPIAFDGNKELNGNGDGLQSAAIADKIEFLTNDQGDMFYSPRKDSSNKNTDSTVGRSDELESTEIDKIKNAHYKLEEDDSDMLMEPDEFRATALIPTHATGNFFQSNEFRSNEFRPFAPEYVHLERPLQQRIRSIEDTRAVPPQNLFPPSFFRNVPPLGHSRPYFSSQESHSGRFNAGRSYDQTILGSGDFGVIRGGTFYQDDDPPARSSYESGSDELLGFFNSNNGHGRPHSAFVPKTFYPDEQFANFRDFAGINTPTDPAYSQYVVVYANKNSTDPHPNPKNIFEQLELLDKEGAEEERKQKKNSISKFKKKLAKTKLEKKYKKKIGAKDNTGDYEPLLALS